MLGYAVGVGLMQAIGFDMGFLVWLIGIVAAIVVGAGVLFLNVQKWVVIAATAILGAAVITGTFLFLFGGPAAQLAAESGSRGAAVLAVLTISFLLLAILGGVAQFQTTSGYEVESYNRFAEMSGAEPSASWRSSRRMSETPTPTTQRRGWLRLGADFAAGAGRPAWSKPSKVRATKPPEPPPRKRRASPSRPRTPSCSCC